MERSEEKTTLTKRITITAILLAVCIVSQIFKNISVYITGPVVNLCLILAVVTAGLLYGIILAAITPVTAFLITGSPVMMVVPAVIPFIILGNIVLVVMVNFFFKPALTGTGRLLSPRSVIMAVLSSLAKGAFMGVTISLWLLPSFIPEASPLMGKLGVLQTTFSIAQFVTAIIAFVYFYIIWTPLSKSLEKEGQ